MKNHEIVNTNVSTLTDEQVLAKAIIMAKNEFDAGWRLSYAQFAEEGTGAISTYCSDPTPNGCEPWDNVSDEYDCRLDIVTIVRKDGEHAYMYRQEGSEWIPMSKRDEDATVHVDVSCPWDSFTSSVVGDTVFLTFADGRRGHHGIGQGCFFVFDSEEEDKEEEVYDENRPLKYYYYNVDLDVWFEIARRMALAAIKINGRNDPRLAIVARK